MKNASTAAVVWWQVAAVLGECTSSVCLVTFYSSCSAKVSQFQIMKPPGQKESSCRPLSASYCLTMSVSDRFVCISLNLIKSMFSHFYCLLFPVHLFPHHAFTHPHILSYEVNARMCCCYRPSSCTCPLQASERGLELVWGVRRRSASWTRDYWRARARIVSQRAAEQRGVWMGRTGGWI